MIEIDGSFGEGGGQILRTSLSLSCLTQKPFRIFNIRKGRKKPGLMPQHLTCVHALKHICNATVRGDVKGARELFFEPRKVQQGKYVFDIGTAGSTSLLLQAVLPPLISAQGNSSLILRGGTHVPFSPTFHYVQKVFTPLLQRLGITLHVDITSYGFYPKGGGQISIEISPAREIKGIALTKRDAMENLTGLSGTGNLPLSIAERQRKSALQLLSEKGFDAEIETLSVPTPGQGTFIFLKTEGNQCIAGFSSLGERGKKAEIVGKEAAQSFLNYDSTSACLDHHIADQIVIYLAMAKSSSSFTTSHISQHLHTNLWVIAKFLNVQYNTPDIGISGQVTITPR